MAFDYENKVWSAAPMRPNIFYIQYLHFRYASSALSAVPSGGRVLDIGCGGGSLTAALAQDRPDLQFTGVDISQAAIRQASNFQLPNLKFELIKPDAFGLSYCSKAFEAVLLVDVLEHLEEPLAMLSQAYHSLRDKGVLYASIPTEGVWWCLHYWLMKLGWRGKLEQSGHIQAYTPQSVKKLLRETGFEFVRGDWGFHLTSQFLDVVYSLFWVLLGKKPHYSLEGYREKIEPGWKQVALVWFSKIVFAVMNVESLLLSKVPGMGWHVVAKKLQ